MEKDKIPSEAETKQNVNNQKRKIVIIGDSGVGKTSLIQRFIHKDNWHGNYITTITDYHNVSYHDDDNNEYKMMIWDTAGQEQYRSITRSYLRGADGIFLVFDLNSFTSFENLPYWINVIQDIETTNIVLIGNKSDIDNENDFRLKVQEFVNEYHFIYYETSAKDNINVEQAFNEMFRLLTQKNICDTDDETLTTPMLISNQSIKLKSVQCC